MILYVAIHGAVYYLLFKYLPFLNQQALSNDWLLQVIRHAILLFVSSHLTNFLWRQRFVPKMRIKPKGLAVLVTGCDTGFGNLLARKLHASGFKVFAGCLFPAGPGAKQLSADCPEGLTILKLDVTSDCDVDAAQEAVKRELELYKQELFALVNNAGILATGEVEFGKSLAPFDSQMQVNCLGTIRVTKAFTPLLRRCTNWPRLVNVTSLAARISLPGMVGYCVSKSAALSFTDGIRVELKKWNIQVVSIEPHLFKTNLIASEAQERALRDLWLSSRPETLADYGEKFFEGAKRLLDHGIGSARTNVKDVVQAMYDSVTIRFPETHRKVCSSDLERLRCWLLINILPSSWQVYLLHQGAAFITGKPALLDRSKKAV